MFCPWAAGRFPVCRPGDTHGQVATRVGAGLPAASLRPVPVPVPVQRPRLPVDGSEGMVRLLGRASMAGVRFVPRPTSRRRHGPAVAAEIRTRIRRRRVALPDPDPCRMSPPGDGWAVPRPAPDEGAMRSGLPARGTACPVGSPGARSRRPRRRIGAEVPRRAARPRGGTPGRGSLSAAAPRGERPIR